MTRLLALATLCGLGCSSSEIPPPAPLQWRFAIEEIDGSVQAAYAAEFKRLIEAGSDGQIQVTIYPYGTLGTSDQLTELVHGDAIQFVTASPGHLGVLIPEVQVFLLPFLFSDNEHVNQRVLEDAELRRLLLALYSEKDLAFLSAFTEGFQVWSANRPLRAPEDFSGLKIRVMASPILLATYKAYGANPTPLPFSEVYSALQLSMIDAQVNPIFAIEEMSFYEVNDTLTFAHEAPFITTVVTNTQFYKTLSPRHRQLLDTTLQELGNYILEVQQTFNAKRLAVIREKRPDINLVYLTASERAAFRNLTAATHQEFAAQVGTRGDMLLRRIRSAVAEFESELSTTPNQEEAATP